VARRGRGKEDGEEGKGSKGGVASGLQAHLVASAKQPHMAVGEAVGVPSVQRLLHCLCMWGGGVQQGQARFEPRQLQHVGGRQGRAPAARM